MVMVMVMGLVMAYRWNSGLSDLVLVWRINNASQMGTIFYPCSVNQAVVIVMESRQMERRGKGKRSIHSAR